MIEVLNGFGSLLLQLILVPTKSSVQAMEQAINHVIMLKQFVNSIRPIYEALSGARSAMLSEIRAVRLHSDMCSLR